VEQGLALLDRSASGDVVSPYHIEAAIAAVHATALSVEVEGRKDGGRGVRRGDVVMAHQEANRRRSTTAGYYLSAVGAAIGVALIADEAVPGPGVYPPEALDPARVFKEWSARDLPVAPNFFLTSCRFPRPSFVITVQSHKLQGDNT